MSLINRLAEIRELQGKEPLSDPTRIDGPPLTPQEAARIEDVYPDREDGDEDYVEPPSPLLPRRENAPPVQDYYVAKTGTSALPEPAIAAATFQLLVCDKEAAYQGYAVTLSQAEYASLVETVINATKRVLQDRLAEVQTARWEEMRATQAGSEAAKPGDPDAGQSVPRKRGRPKKTQ